MSTADCWEFLDSKRTDGSNKRDIYLNGPDDGIKHGHVVVHELPDGTTVEEYGRDVEGNEFYV